MSCRRTPGKGCRLAVVDDVSEPCGAFTTLLLLRVDDAVSVQEGRCDPSAYTVTQPVLYSLCSVGIHLLTLH